MKDTTELIIVDPNAEYGDKSCAGINYSLVFEEPSMERNVPCFCGSGKKYKRCHAEINEKSLVANLLKIYHQMDSEFVANAQPSCCLNCSECCIDDFEVSVAEFFTILQYLRAKDDNVLRSYWLSAIERLKSTGSLITRRIAPCILLDDTTGLCRIYEVRPIICRKYGSFLNSADADIVCDKIRENTAEREKLQLLNPAIDVIRNVKILENAQGKPVYIKEMPIVYWLANNMSQDGNLRTMRLQNAFEAAVGKSIENFVKTMLIA